MEHLKIKTVILSMSITIGIFGAYSMLNAEKTDNLERYAVNSSTLTVAAQEKIAEIEASANDTKEAIALEQAAWDEANKPPEPVIEEAIVDNSIYHTETLPGLADFYNTYRGYYETAQGCHPYILAAIHYREKNFGNTNGWNGQGAFQNLNNRYIPESVVTDWNEQVQQACDHLRQPYGWIFLTDLNDQESIGNALASYNGCRGLYYKQCSYVVNKTNLMAVGTKCAVDGCAYTTTDNRFGALSIISQLQELQL